MGNTDDDNYDDDDDDNTVSTCTCSWLFSHS